MKVLIIATALFASVISATPLAEAHESRPAQADVSVSPDGALKAVLTLDIEAFLAGPDADHDEAGDTMIGAQYRALRGMAPEGLAREAAGFASVRDAVQLRVDGKLVPTELGDISIPATGDTSLSRRSALIYRADDMVAGEALTVSFAPEVGAVILRVTGAGPDSKPVTQFLQSGQSSDPIPFRGAAAGVSEFQTYVISGFVHIIPLGLDHILFVIALFLAGAAIRPLAVQVTVFTLAHSVTLALSAMGHISVPAEIVEPLIAASLIFVAVENILSPRLRSWRLAVIFAFGLMHGLGFAGVMAEAFPADEVSLLALLGFNIGVEIGQIAVIAACYLAVGLGFAHRRWYQQGIVVPASLAIAAIGVLWVVERTGLVG